VSAAVLVFVNERPVRVAAGADALAAVAALDPALGRQLAAGAAQLSDGRGIPLAPATPVFAGAIFRCVVSARRPRDEADAHA
jgi:hypothetical protein